MGLFFTRLLCLSIILTDSSLCADDLLIWDEGEGHLAVRKGEKDLWRFNAKKGKKKPFFHPLATADGSVLTQNRPADHVWHHGLWFSFKKINGVNFWEEDKKTEFSDGNTEVVHISTTKRDDFGAIIGLKIKYSIPAKGDAHLQNLVHEDRMMTVSSPDAMGNYSIDFQHAFTALQDDVTLGRTPLLDEPNGRSYGGYAGLSFRHYGHVDDWQIKKDWKFIVPNPVKNLHGTRQSWMAYSGPLGENTAGTAIFDHPSNFNYPTHWYAAPGLVFYSPSFLFTEARSLKKGEKLNLAYRVRIYSSAPKLEQLTQEAKQFAAKEFPPLAMAEMKKVDDSMIDLVQHGKSIFNIHCALCHNVQPIGTPDVIEKIGPSFHGLLQTKAHKKQVFEKNQLVNVTVDDDYIESSMLTPMRHMAIKKVADDPIPYPPGMPRYDYKGNDLKGIIAYLRTLNEDANKGPDQVWATVELPDESENDRFEIETSERTRIVRAIFPGVSTRAIAVGSPSNFHYIFDPSWLSVRKVWAGGFLNMKVEHTDRGKGQNSFGNGAWMLDFGNAVRPLLGEQPVDFSHKDFPADQSFAMKTLQEDLDQASQPLTKIPEGVSYHGYRLNKDGTPVFLFEIDGTQYEERITVLDESTLKLDFSFKRSKQSSRPIRFSIDHSKVALSHSIGTLADGVLTIPQESTQATLEIKRLK